MIMDELPEPVSYDHVLLPLDGSGFSAAALPTASALAARFDAGLTTISVAADEREAEGLRRQAEESLAEGSSLGVVDVVVGRDPAQTVTARAQELGSCVVCMSTSAQIKKIRTQSKKKCVLAQKLRAQTEKKRAQTK